MRLLIKFPTRGRKDKFFSTLDKYYEYCSDIDNSIFYSNSIMDQWI